MVPGAMVFGGLKAEAGPAKRYRELVLDGIGRRHDVIDPTTFPQGRTLVYPKLEALVLE